MRMNLFFIVNGALTFANEIISELPKPELKSAPRFLYALKPFFFFLFLFFLHVASRGRSKKAA